MLGMPVPPGHLPGAPGHPRALGLLSSPTQPLFQTLPPAQTPFLPTSGETVRVMCSGQHRPRFLLVHWLRDPRQPPSLTFPSRGRAGESWVAQVIMSTGTGPGMWEALRKGSYPWIPRTTLNFPAAGSLRTLEKRAVRWDPEDAQDLDPWSQGRRYRKEQEGAGCGMEQTALWKRQELRAAASTLESSAFPSLEDKARTVLPLQLARANPQTREQLSTRLLGNSPPQPSPLHCSPFSGSQRSLPGVPLVSKAPARTQGRSWEEPQRWSQGTGTQDFSEKAAAAAISSQDTGAWSHSPGMGAGAGWGTPVLSTAHHPPRKNP